MSRVLPAAPVYFLRHGESEANRAGIVAGAGDAALTDAGRHQAREALARLQGVEIAHVYTSRLARARETAEIVAAGLDLAVETVPDLDERDWGAWQGLLVASVDRTATPPGGESEQAFAARTLAALAAVAWRTPPLIVAHAGTFRVLARHLGLVFSGPRIGNAVPVRLDSPEDGSGPWTWRAI